MTGEGDADLLVNPGKYNFPRSSDVWKISDSFKSDEITLRPSDHKKYAQHGEDTVFYTIAVGVIDDCQFNLIALDTDLTIIHSEIGHVYSTRVKEGNPVILKIPNFDWEKITTVVFWSDVNIDVAYKLYKDTGENTLYEQFPNNFDPDQSAEDVSSSSARNFARRISIETKPNCPYCYHLLAFYHKDDIFGSSGGLINMVALYRDSNIELPGKQSFRDVLQKDENQSYSFTTKYECTEVSLEVEVESGRVSFSEWMK